MIRSVHKAPRLIFRAIALMDFCVALLCLSGSYSYWYNHRPLPRAVERELFQGVIYQREVQTNPRPVVIHVLRIDLDAPGLEFFVTPATPVDEHETRAMTTGKFLRQYDLQIAINGSFFYPFHSNAPWDYYPHAGDPVDAIGVAASRGETWSTPQENYTTLNITQDNRVQIGNDATGLYNALAGRPVLLPPEPVDESYLTRRHPRTAIAVDDDGGELLIIVIDGRQPTYSDGATLDELTEIILRHGGDRAINLDGGGSSTLVIQGPDGRPKLLNSPIHTRIPGRQRPVANHLGIRAERLVPDE